MSPAEKLAVDQALDLPDEKPKRAKKEPAVPPVVIRPREVPSVEELFTSPGGFGISTATPVQRAICRAADGLPMKELWKFKDVRAAFGGKRPPVGKRPRTLVVLAGTRGGKSLLGSAIAVRSGLTCDVSGLVPSDELRIPCLATALDTADVIYSHALGLCQGSLLMGTVVGKPLTRSFRIAREGVNHVEIATTALSAKGSSLVARWMGGAVFDEAPRMGSEEDTVRSLKSSRRAVADRILPGGQELLIGSPYAPHGEVYEIVRERFGHPDEDVVVIRASGPMLNPYRWTPEFMEQMRRTDPFVWLTSGKGEWADPESALIPSSSIEACMSGELDHPRRKSPKWWTPIEYVAALAPAERGAGWTLVVLGTTGLDKDNQRVMEQAIAQQWFGTAHEPLEPRKTLREVRDICSQYGVDQVHMDRKFVAGLEPLAAGLDFGLVGVKMEADERLEMCDALRGAIVEHRLRLTANRQCYTDLQRVQKKPTVNGTTVHYPSSGDATACDFVQPLGIAVLNAPDPPVNMEPAKMDPIDEIMAGLASDPFERAAMAVLG